MAIDWNSPTWGSPATCVHIGITDDLGDGSGEMADEL
jgi:hypothetical protein